MDIEWDAAKARSNLRKHSVSFDEAASVFHDALALTGDDPDHSVGEPRFVTFGTSSSGKLLAVFHIVRAGCIRLISARPTTKSERKIYEEG